jgi:hypothetical protein
LADYVREFKIHAFEFGPYNHVRYDQAPKGAALVRCAPYLMCWLRAGLTKVHVQMLRNILKLLDVKFAHEFPLNPIQDVDFNGFVAFVARRTNLMFYHVRRLRRQDKFQGRFERTVDPAEKTRLKVLLDKMPAEDVDDSEANPTPGPTEEQSETQEPEMKLRKKRRARMQAPKERVRSYESNFRHRTMDTSWNRSSRKAGSRTMAPMKARRSF